MYDSAEVKVKAGNGGDGAISFRREKFAPMGGPDGGNGGRGGDVVLAADSSVASLRLFKRNRLYRAGDGGDGRGQKKTGKKGIDLVLKVPVGTIVKENDATGDKKILADLTEERQEAIVAQGGDGGWGNTHFATSTNRTPRIAQKGETGGEKTLSLELRLIADVGIIGFPNVGKSSLLAAASGAKPKIADYAFTTLEPIPGVVEFDNISFVMAEIPGLIEGAHAGRGLGSDFLRHALRTKVLVHLIDGSSPSPVEDMVKVNTELRLFDGGLAGKPQVIAINKIDLPDVKERTREIRDLFHDAGMRIFFISAVTGEGVRALMEEAAGMLRQLEPSVAAKEPFVFRPAPKTVNEVQKEGETFVINSPEVQRILARVDISDQEIMRQMRGQLERVGIGRALKSAGIQPGDKVRAGEYEWEW